MTIKSTAVLCLSNTDDDYIIIPVINFPLLPIGSFVDVYLDDAELALEDLVIEDYRASNNHGTQINVAFKDSYADDEAVERGDAIWEKLVKLCEHDKSNLGNWVYLKVIDFGKHHSAY